MAEPSKHLDDLAESIKRVIPKTHASNVMILSARLEETLSLIIQGNMPNLTNNKKIELFEGYGPLNSLASKIEIAYALGFIVAEERRNLQAIKAIRNVFAHSPDFSMNFAHPSLEKALAMLPPPKIPETTGMNHFFEVYQTCATSLKNHTDAINLVQALKARVDSKKTSPEK
jgi:hypothetical protein